MGTPASSALRADTATNSAALHGAGGDPYGSLTGLGGPKKFKKKPVLVLDPEELERAHLMFQEASAELLGEEVERAPKPAVTMLGLAPMDDEDSTPDDMGQSDDDQDGGDDEAIPTAEELLQMTTSSRAVEEDEEEQAYAMQALEAGFDEEHRIFPTLPMRPEEEIAAEEAAEFAGSEPEEVAPAEAPLEASHDEEPEALPEAELPAEPVQQAPKSPTAEDRMFKLSPLTSGEFEDEEDEEMGPSVNFAALMPQIRRETPIRPPEEREAASEPAPAPEPDPLQELEPEPDPEPVAELPPIEASFWDEEPAPLPEESATLPGQDAEASITPEVTYEAAPRFEDAPADQPLSKHIGPFEMQRAAKPIVPETPAVEVDAEEPAPGFSASVLPPQPPVSDHHDDWEPLDAAPVEEPEHPATQDFDADEVQDWEPESYDAADQMDAEDEWLPEPEMEREAAYVEDGYREEAEEDPGNYTVVEDEPVDGYAFMYADNPRGRTLRSVAPGEANSLRARLVREREELHAETESKRSNPSVLARFTNWLRGLFG